MKRNGHPPRSSSHGASKPSPPPSSYLSSSSPYSSSYSSSSSQRYRDINPDDIFGEDGNEDKSSHGDDEDDGDGEDDYLLDLDDDEMDSFTSNKYFDESLPPPLPLYDIGPDETSNPLPKTISGCSIRTIPHIKNNSPERCKLYDPLLSRYSPPLLSHTHPFLIALPFPQILC